MRGDQSVGRAGRAPTPDAPPRQRRRRDAEHEERSPERLGAHRRRDVRGGGRKRGQRDEQRDDRGEESGHALREPERGGRAERARCARDRASAEQRRAGPARRGRERIRQHQGPAERRNSGTGAALRRRAGRPTGISPRRWSAARAPRTRPRPRRRAASGRRAPWRGGAAHRLRASGSGPRRAAALTTRRCAHRRGAAPCRVRPGAGPRSGSRGAFGAQRVVSRQRTQELERLEAAGQPRPHLAGRRAE